MDDSNMSARTRCIMYIHLTLMMAEYSRKPITYLSTLSLSLHQVCSTLNHGEDNILYIIYTISTLTIFQPAFNLLSEKQLK